MTTVAEHIAEILVEKLEVPAEKVDFAVEFEAMDLDSLVLVQLAVILENWYGTPVEDWEIREAGTIENTVGMLRAKGAV